MTNSQILTKAIKKAYKNNQPKIWEKWTQVCWDSYLNDKIYYSLIFSHDFAKCLFGEEIYEGAASCPACEHQVKNWEYHLMAMVLEPNPLKYLEKFL